MKKNEIVIKDTNVLRGLMERNYAPLLITIICEIIDNFGIRMSESWREKKHPNDLHGTNPVRAIDISEWVYNDGQAQDIEKWINNRWVYDPDRTRMKVAVLHKVRGGVLHFHIQVHQNTIRRAG